MGCPYIRNKNDVVYTPEGKAVTVTTGGQTICPSCGGADIAVKFDECKCTACGFILCGAIPRC